MRMRRDEFNLLTARWCVFIACSACMRNGSQFVGIVVLWMIGLVPVPLPIAANHSACIKQLSIAKLETTVFSPTSIRFVCAPINWNIANWWLRGKSICGLLHSIVFLEKLFNVLLVRFWLSLQKNAAVHRRRAHARTSYTNGAMTARPRSAPLSCGAAAMATHWIGSTPRQNVWASALAKRVSFNHFSDRIV